MLPRIFGGRHGDDIYAREKSEWFHGLCLKQELRAQKRGGGFPARGTPRGDREVVGEGQRHSDSLTIAALVVCLPSGNVLKKWDSLQTDLFKLVCLCKKSVYDVNVATWGWTYELSTV